MESKPLITFFVIIQFLQPLQSLNLFPASLPKLPRLSLPDIPLIPGLSTANLTSLLDNVDFDFESKIKNAEAFYKTLPVTVTEDAKLLVPELVKKYGYPCESHTVTTTDGYILTLHRIPHGKGDSSSKNRPAVYVQHGLLCSSADWLLAGPEKSLGYILADAGYDVWLSNVRGNRYSRKHSTLDPNSAEFWNFSWHEIALNDVTAMIDYVLKQTSQDNLHYIGHSQGTTVFYVMCSEKPEYNKKIKVQMSLAPIGYMDHLVSPLIRLLARVDLGAVTKLVGANEFLPTTKFLAIVGKFLCSDNSVTQVLCTNALFALAGFNQKQMNATLLPVLMGHTPAGSATKQIFHYTQEINSGKFEKWNGGLLENKKLYNSIQPPSYNIEKITAPVYLYYSRNDWLSHEIDVNRLHEHLPNVKSALDSLANSEFLLNPNVSEICSIFLILNNVFNITQEKKILSDVRTVINIPEDATLRVPELVQKYGYPCESHTVVTTDGYILTMHRIPFGRNNNFNKYRPAVFLQHGILSGNRYSRGHLDFNPFGNKFWDFSWHEIGVYDIPEFIDYILHETNQDSLYYIGHSQGTTVFYVMCSEKPEYNRKIKLSMNLAPTAYMKHLISPPVQTLARFESQLYILSKATGIYEILPTSSLFSAAAQELCNDYVFTQIMCVDFLFLIFGPNPKQINASLMPIVAGHTPAGASAKQLLHYAQLINSGTFRKWDGGVVENLLLYGSGYPPEYRLESITAPIYLYFSRNDFMSNETDVNRLKRRLPNVKRKILISDPDFNHIDYLYAKQAPKLLYRLLIKAMRTFQ
ncbi:hypothetical protein RN001_016426 [Aquatica leii]|uniref:Partial AB-hydrolase lipase domain-containing protein n=1 Tax=Aquatica leii TaxID=1421715 RepID=A0AAN7PP70_9COLE|nr:hypothetical protein RN001_016426 [Aquatica leii]